MRLVAARGTGARDVQLAVGALVAGSVLLALGGFFQIPGLGFGLPRALFVVPLVVVCVGLGLRRVAPLGALALGVLALAADVALGGSIANILIFTQVLYEVCVHGPAWLLRWALRISIGITLVATVVGVIAVGSWRGAALGVPFALVFILTVVSAISVRQYRDQAELERDRADQTGRLAELDRAQAVTAERNRMARELHDVIANHLSAVAIHATALLSLKDLDRREAERALHVIRDNSVQGLAEMREMVELLRDPAGATPEAPTRARLSEAKRLADQAREAGLDVELEVAGSPRPLPVNVDLAAYRILQESLTNALKHGAGRGCVTISYEPSGVSLTITNALSSAAALVPGSGAGLIGMRERAALLGGRLTAGPDGAGWRVHAHLPTETAA